MSDELVHGIGTLKYMAGQTDADDDFMGMDRIRIDEAKALLAYIQKLQQVISAGLDATTGVPLMGEWQAMAHRILRED